MENHILIIIFRGLSVNKQNPNHKCLTNWFFLAKFYSLLTLLHGASQLGGILKTWPKLSSEDFFELPELVGLDHISGLLVHLIHLLWLDSGLLMNKATFVLQIHESLFVFLMKIEVVPEIEIVFLLNSACSLDCLLNHRWLSYLNLTYSLQYILDYDLNHWSC